MVRRCLGSGEKLAPGKEPSDPEFGVIEHSELDDLHIAHVDCDAFFASVEKRDNPDLKHKPVIVGGQERGVVSAACYIARTYGVHSAMPSFQAKRLCPNAVFVKPRFDAYREASISVREEMEALTPLVEPVSIDEAFLDLSGTERLHGKPPSASLVGLQRTVESRVGVTVSVGLSHNKSMAKLASELDKPRGYAVIGKEETLEFLGRLPVKAIFGVGKSFAEKLRRSGIESVADIQKLDVRELVERYGESGLKLHARAHGKDPRPIRTDRKTKSISGETTFGSDLRDAQQLEDHLYAMCKKVSVRAKAKGYAGLVITLKLKTNQFRSLTRRRTLGVATNLTEVIFSEGRSLLREELSAGSRSAYRLIGIGLSDLVTAEDARLDLAYPEEHEKLRHKEDALADLRARFGEDVIGTMRDRRTSKS